MSEPELIPSFAKLLHSRRDDDALARGQDAFIQYLVFTYNSAEVSALERQPGAFGLIYDAWLSKG